MDFNSFIALTGDFLFDKQFLNLFVSTIVLFAVSFVSWQVYSNQLAKRDLFKIGTKPDSSVGFFNRLVYFMKYLVVFPFYSFMWFLLFSFLLFLLSKSRPIEEIFFFGIVIVASTRIGAYVSDRLAEDMAKLLPWSLILIFLIDPHAITFGGILDSFAAFVQQIPKILKYLLFIVAVEWALRVGYWIVKPKKSRQSQ